MKNEYYLRIALAVAQRGTCKRRNYGAIIVIKDEIISSGYSGAPRGWPNCLDLPDCQRITQGIKSGERYDLCRSVHAEQNAIISASRADMMGGTMYISGFDMETGLIVEGNPCYLCTRFIIQAGIEEVRYSLNQKPTEIWDLLRFKVIQVENIQEEIKWQA
jgi:dCMP deaminase